MIRTRSVLILALMANSCGDDAGTPEATRTLTTTEPSKSDDATPDDATSDDTTADDATRDDATPDDGSPDDPTRDDATPDAATPDDPTRDDATPDDATPDAATPDDPTRDDPTPDAATPDDPTRDDVENEVPLPVPGQPAPWAELNKSQRFAFMANVVVPKIRAILTAVDPAYQNLSCNSCHGDNAGEVGFKMPNGVSPLNPAHFPLTQSDDPRIARMAKVMGEEVVPTMAALLGTKPRSRDNPMGLGCFSCHGRVASP